MMIFLWTGLSKVRDGIRTSDKINDSLKRVIAGKVDLAELYKKRVGHNPASISLHGIADYRFGYKSTEQLKVAEQAAKYGKKK